MKNLIGPVLLFVIAIGFISGCGSGNSPVAPDNTGNEKLSVISPVSRGRSLWGVWDCYLDPSDNTIHSVPLRTAEFTANVNNLLESKSGNLIISDLDLSDLPTEGLVNCTVSLQHPFTGLDQYHGFDVWGTFMHNGSGTLGYGGLTYGAADSDTDAVLLNADGYTRWFNYGEFNGGTLPLFEFTPGKLASLPNPTATLNGFKIFADGLQADDDYYSWITTEPDLDDRGIFRAGELNSRRYELEFPLPGGIPDVKFQYAVIATWEPGDPELTGQPTLYEPDDFPLSANVDEPFFIKLDTSGSSLFNDGSASGGSFNAKLEIFDWSAMKTSGDSISDELQGVVILCDTIPGGIFTIDSSMLESIAVEGPLSQWMVDIEITNCDPPFSETDEVWIVAESATPAGQSYFQGFPTQYPDGVRAAFKRGAVGISQVIPENVIVSSINPDNVPFWSYIDDGEISGIGFLDGCTIELRKGTDTVAADNVTWQSSASVLASFDLDGVDSGLWDVAVVNPDNSEGILSEGLTIDVWSEELEIANGSYRLPAMAERLSGPVVLVFGQNDLTVRYMEFDPTAQAGTGWSSIGIIDSPTSPPVIGNNLITGVTSDPNEDYVYYMTNPHHLFRYPDSTGGWEEGYHSINDNRTAVPFADSQGQIHWINNSANAFGHIMHMRAPYFPFSFGDLDITLNYFPDGYNALVLSEGNFLVENSAGTIFCAYIKDYTLVPATYGSYNPNGPRWIRVTPMYNGGMASSYFDVETTSGATAYLDSPTLTIDSTDKLHIAFRKVNTASGDWGIHYESSSNGGSTWVPGGMIYSGSSAPVNGYNYLYADSQDELHSFLSNGNTLEYRESETGATWSSPETANETLTSGDDFHARTIVTSDDIMHFAWIRGSASSGYGNIYYRMRDLQ